MPRPKSAHPKFSLTQRGGIYYVKWWEDGSARRVSCRTSINSEARRFLASFLAGRGNVPPPNLPTIGAILTGYETDRKAHVGPTIKYACAALRGVLGDLPPDLLTRERVRNYAKERRRKRPLSDGTIIRELVTLRAAFRWAIGERWISQEPLVEVPAAPPPRDRWLTRPEAQRLADAAVAPHVRTFIMLGLYTGARAGALLELTWDQIDFEAGRIALGRGRGNKRRAVVPIVAELRSELADALERAVGRYVVSPSEKRLASIKTGFNAAAGRAKLEGVTPHTLRHTAASWMVQRGVPIEQVASFLGNSAAMVEKVYGHQHPDHLRQAADALSAPLPDTLAQETRKRLSPK